MNPNRNMDRAATAVTFNNTVTGQIHNQMVLTPSVDSDPTAPMKGLDSTIQTMDGGYASTVDAMNLFKG